MKTNYLITSAVVLSAFILPGAAWSDEEKEAPGKTPIPGQYDRAGRSNAVPPENTTAKKTTAKKTAKKATTKKGAATAEASSSPSVSLKKAATKERTETEASPSASGSPIDRHAAETSVYELRAATKTPPRPTPSPKPHDRAGREMSTTSELGTPTPESPFDRTGRPAYTAPTPPNK
jgi:hypothetical protein